MSGSDPGLPWGGALAAAGMTLAVVALGFVLIGGLQDPDTPMPAESAERLAQKKAELLAAQSTCSVADVTYAAAVHGPDGEAEAHAPTHDLTAWVAVINPCSAPVSFTTPTLCLFDGFELLQEGSPPRPGGTMCGQALTEWTLPAGGVERWSYKLGNLPAGEYQVAARFSPGDGRAKATFTVR